MPFYDLPLAELRTYQSSVETPADFADFWKTTLTEARSHARPPVFTPVAYGLTAFEVFDVTYSGFGGHEIKAWLILPAHCAAKCPAIVKYIGYGGGRGFPHEHLLWPAAGYAVFVMDTRGQGSSWSKGDTPDPAGSAPAGPGSMTRGLSSPETYYYRRVYTDAVRAIETIRAHDAIDPTRVALTGGSQGGGISLAAGGLSEGLRGVMADVPYLSDFPRAITTAQDDPYTEIARYLAVHRDKLDAAMKTLAYFDTVCFSRIATAPVLMSVALMDTICPPSTVFGTFNAYATKDKTLIDYPFNNHEGGGPFQEKAQLEWLAPKMR